MPYIIENHSIVNVNHGTVEYPKMNYTKKPRAQMSTGLLL